MRSGEGAREEDRLGGLEGGREELREGGSEDREGPEMEEFRELCRDLTKQHQNFYFFKLTLTQEQIFDQVREL